MKNQRQQKIISIIKNSKVRTHEQLVDELANDGILVTQATVSRDIKDLGIVKVPDEDGSIYSATSEWNNPLIKFASDVKDIKTAGNLVVLHTLPGVASAIAAAIDAELKPQILGCIAGDDTIFVAVESTEYAHELIENLNQYLQK